MKPQQYIQGYDDTICANIARIYRRKHGVAMKYRPRRVKAHAPAAYYCGSFDLEHFFAAVFFHYLLLFILRCVHVFIVYFDGEISSAENERYRPLFVPRMPYSTNFQRLFLFFVSGRRFICSGFVFMYGYLLSRVLFLRL